MFQLRGCSPPSISAVCLKQMRTRGAGMGASSHLFSSLSVCAEVGGQWWGGGEGLPTQECHTALLGGQSWGQEAHKI